jgi:putative transposase
MGALVIAKAMPSRSFFPNQHWAVDVTSVWSAQEGWGTLACVIHTCTREIVGWRLSKSGKAALGPLEILYYFFYRRYFIGLK